MGNYDDVVIINLSNTIIKNSNFNYWRKGKPHVLNYKLSETCKYKTFEKSMRALIDHIRSYPSDHEIIINCRKGVVRSVATAMCLAMVTKNMTYDEALEYIDKKKEEIDPMWASMT